MSDDLDEQARKLTRELIANDPLLVALGRALAPTVNARLAAMPKKKEAPKASDFCPGCGDQHEAAPDLCDECAAVGTPPAAPTNEGDRP